MAKQARDSVSVPAGISASLFQVGLDLHDQGKVHQSLTALLKVIEQYPDSKEAPAAIDKVLNISESLRKEGQYHVAMRVLDRLEAAYQTEP
jgi:TolA-binding protein